MGRTPQDVTETELAILSVLWERGEATVRQLAKGVYRESTGNKHASVLKLLERLEAKQFVRRDRDRWPHVFRQTIAREELVNRRSQATADELCDGSMELLIPHCVRAKRLNAEERQSLRGLLEDLDQDTTP